MAAKVMTMRSAILIFLGVTKLFIITAMVSSLFIPDERLI